MGFFDSGNIFEKIGQVFTDPKAAWDEFRTGGANATNAEIAEENLDYQRERNEIEDQRYNEETEYNRAFQEEERDYQRAFAEDERAYNRALQERLFEREDTAQLRQAEQLSALGINPLSQQLNGAGAGQVVGSSGSGSTVGSPAGSARGGQALHNSFNQTPISMEGALSALSGLATTVNGVTTGQYQRDALALENDRKYLENLVYARKNGIDYVGPEVMQGPNYRKHHWINSRTGQEYFYEPDWLDARGSELKEDYNTNREVQSKREHNVFDWESDNTRTLKSLGTLDFQNLASSLLTNIAKAGNWVNGNLKDFDKDMQNNAIMDFIRKFFAM